jgi:hypothetical protein
MTRVTLTTPPGDPLTLYLYAPPEAAIRRDAFRAGYVSVAFSSLPDDHPDTDELDSRAVSDLGLEHVAAVFRTGWPDGVNVI